MDKKERVLELRGKGLSIAEIARLTEYTVTEICEVLYEKNNEDKRDADL